MRPEYRWQVEIKAATHPVEEWLPLRNDMGKPYKFVERGEAETAIARLKRVQPHLVLRIRAI